MAGRCSRGRGLADVIRISRQLSENASPWRGRHVRTAVGSWPLPPGRSSRDCHRPATRTARTCSFSGTHPRCAPTTFRPDCRASASCSPAPDSSRGTPPCLHPHRSRWRTARSTSVSSGSFVPRSPGTKNPSPPGSDVKRSKGVSASATTPRMPFSLDAKPRTR